MRSRSPGHGETPEVSHPNPLTSHGRPGPEQGSGLHEALRGRRAGPAMAHHPSFPGISRHLLGQEQFNAGQALPQLSPGMNGPGGEIQERAWPFPAQVEHSSPPGTLFLIKADPGGKLPLPGPLSLTGPEREDSRASCLPSPLDPNSGPIITPPTVQHREKRRLSPCVTL